MYKLYFFLKVFGPEINFVQMRFDLKRENKICGHFKLSCKTLGNTPRSFLVYFKVCQNSLQNFHFFRKCLKNKLNMHQLLMCKSMLLWSYYLHTDHHFISTFVLHKTSVAVVVVCMMILQVH